MFYLLLFLHLLQTSLTFEQVGPLHLLYKWRSIDYEFPSKAARNNMIKDGTFIPGNGAPIDVEYWQKGHTKKTFITMPKFAPGIPATLGLVTDQKQGDAHLIRPYPSWSWHLDKRCEGITSAFRTKVDACNRLWVVDSAAHLYKNPVERPCQPQLLAFSLENDQLAGRHQFTNDVTPPTSILAAAAVDVRDAHDQCLDTFVYISDVTGFGLIVFDARKNRSWRVKHRSMFPVPSRGVYRTNGVEFDLMDGILGLAVTEMQNGDRKLYYHAFSSFTENWVSTSVIRNESSFSNGNSDRVKNNFNMFEEARSSQAASEVFDHQGTLYFGMVASNSLNCWNSQKPFTANNIHTLIKDDTNLQFITGIKIWPKEDGTEELYIFTTRFQLFMVNKMSPKEVNFRILKGNLNEMTRNSPCKSNHKPPHSSIYFPKKPYKSGYGNFGR